MVEKIGKLEWQDGVLTASSPNIPPLTWARPADLAEARLEIDPPPARLELADGADILAAAFEVLPFVREPLPKPVFGDAVTPAARAAYEVLSGQVAAQRADAFRVLRGEPGAFVVAARRYHDVWTVGACTVAEMTLTVRFEDLWNQLPATRRFGEYLVEVVRDPHAKDAPAAEGCVRETLTDVAPDARLCLDLAASGGFRLTFWPVADRPTTSEQKEEKA